MKQKVVIKVTMNGPKSRTKAMKIAVTHSGVESAGWGGKDKNQIEVTGDGVDAAELTTLLRKNVGYAELVSVTPVGDKKEDKKEDKKDEEKMQQVVWPYGGGVPHYVYPVNYQYQYQDSYSSCSIM
ncbi:hypothetical protein Tsubulata_031053 [Turnera subulata]|uniref:HMA domain-containing protein n=1 Tax=Turnera subulata TaxID=218843 RepID=A0A9Q0FFL6_9ROSI|nr:hypothetical protein Tsubulata_031053 [Turnera subulata]